MEPYLRLSLLLEALVVGVAVHLVATHRHPRRLFTIDLGREKTDDDRRLGSRVLWWNAMITLIGAAIVLFANDPGVAIAAMLTASLGSPVILLAGTVRAVKRRDEVEIASHYVVPLEQVRARDLLSVPLELFNVTLILATSVAYAVIMPSLPDPMPVHFGIDGKPDRWSSPESLYSIAVMMLFYASISWFVAWISSAERMALAPKAAQEMRGLQLEKRRLTVRMVEWIMIGANISCVICWLGLALMPRQIDLVVLSTIVFSSLSIIAPLALYMTPLIEIGDRITKLGGEGLGTKPSAWRWGGQIYYAPDDPALWVPKRSGIGSTLNFARPGAWLFMIGVVVVPLVLTLVIALAS